MIDKSKDAEAEKQDKASASRGEDHIVANLRHMFQGMEQEALPERFKSLLAELAKKEKS